MLGLGLGLGLGLWLELGLGLVLGLGLGFKELVNVSHVIVDYRVVNHHPYLMCLIVLKSATFFNIF